MRSIKAFSVSMGLLLAALLAPARAAGQLAPSPTPYMGVDTWYAFGGHIDQRVLVRFADEVVRRGLARAGYRIVWLDAGWWLGTRNRRGRIVVDRRQWPNGMAWLTWYLHSRGLEAGIYTDAGTTGCGNAGSYGHYRADVDTFARWGFDAVKVDFCGGESQHLNQRTAYWAFARAIRDGRPHRPMLFAICNGSLPWDPRYGDLGLADSGASTYSFAHRIATSWRTGPDLGVPGDVRFENVLWNIALDARHPRAAGSGHWNDPDYLTPDQGMTFAEDRAQLTMWAILAAPLMLSARIATMPAALVRMYENRTAIAIDQDPLGVQGRRIRTDGHIDVWVKPLSRGAVAVAFLNRGTRTARDMVTASMIGMPEGKPLLVENVWRATRARARRRIRVRVPEHGVVLLRVSRA